MAIIDPVALDDIEEPGLKKLLAEAEALGVPDSQIYQIMAHAPEYAKALGDAMHKSHRDGNVDHKLKEIIRIQLARLAEDPYFGGLRSSPAQAAGLTEEEIDAGSGTFEDDDRFSDAEKWALRYAFLMYREPRKVNAAFYAEGKAHYSEAQIMELGAFIAFHYGMQVFMRTLNVAPAGTGI